MGLTSGGLILGTPQTRARAMRLTGGRLVPWDARGLDCCDEANLGGGGRGGGSVSGNAWRIRGLFLGCLMPDLGQ